MKDKKLEELRRGVYNAASPDEVALIMGADIYGYKFLGISGDNVISYTDCYGTMHKYRLLNTLEFNSSRKRMSVIVQNVDGPQDEYLLLSKGADSIMKPLLDQSLSQTQAIDRVYDIVDANALIGLRTLVLTEKKLSESEYTDFNNRFQEA